MYNTQGGNRSAADARVASIVSDVIFGRYYGARQRQVLSGEKDSLAAVPLWVYRAYAE